MVEINCGPTAADDCHDKVASTHLKVVAIAVILSTSALGVLIPFFGRRSRLFRTDGNPFMVVKAFAAGVILATAFVHMLPAAHRVLSNPCLPEDPWGKFAWAGFITMLAALGTLVMDSAATEFYMNRPEHHHGHHHDSAKIEDSEHKNGKSKYSFQMLLSISISLRNLFADVRISSTKDPHEFLSEKLRMFSQM